MQTQNYPGNIVPTCPQASAATAHHTRTDRRMTWHDTDVIIITEEGRKMQPFAYHHLWICTAREDWDWGTHLPLQERISMHRSSSLWRRSVKRLNACQSEDNKMIIGIKLIFWKGERKNSECFLIREKLLGIRERVKKGTRVNLQVFSGEVIWKFIFCFKQE